MSWKSFFERVLPDKLELVSVDGGVTLEVNDIERTEIEMVLNGNLKMMSGLQIPVSVVGGLGNDNYTWLQSWYKNAKKKRFHGYLKVYYLVYLQKDDLKSLSIITERIDTTIDKLVDKWSIGGIENEYKMVKLVWEMVISGQQAQKDFVVDAGSGSYPYIVGDKVKIGWLSGCGFQSEINWFSIGHSLIARFYKGDASSTKLNIGNIDIRTIHRTLVYITKLEVSMHRIFTRQPFFMSPTEKRTFIVKYTLLVKKYGLVEDCRREMKNVLSSSVINWENFGTDHLWYGVFNEETPGVGEKKRTKNCPFQFLVRIRDLYQHHHTHPYVNGLDLQNYDDLLFEEALDFLYPGILSAFFFSLIKFPQTKKELLADCSFII